MKNKSLINDLLFVRLNHKKFLIRLIIDSSLFSSASSSSDYQSNSQNNSKMKPTPPSTSSTHSIGDFESLLFQYNSSFFS